MIAKGTLRTQTEREVAAIPSEKWWKKVARFATGLVLLAITVWLIKLGFEWPWYVYGGMFVVSGRLLAGDVWTNTLKWSLGFLADILRTVAGKGNNNNAQR